MHMKEVEAVVETFTEEEEEEGDEHILIRQQSSAIVANSLDTFNGNVPLEIENHYIQSLTMRRRCS